MGSLASSIEYQTKHSLMVWHHNNGLRTAIVVVTTEKNPIQGLHWDHNSIKGHNGYAI